MKCRDRWGVRFCPSCQRPIEAFNAPVEDGAYMPCYHCVRLYQATSEGVEIVDLENEPAEFRRVVHDLISAWWAEKAVQVAA